MNSLNKKNLILITARSGSKGLKNKNIKKINYISLIEFKYRCAKKAMIQIEIVVSTESKNIKIFLYQNVKVLERPMHCKR